MKAFIISYDLCAPGRDYTALYKKIQSYPYRVYATESTLIVLSSSNAVDIRDNLLTAMDSDDRLFVAELAGAAAWNNSYGSSEYLKRLLEHK